MNINRVTVSLLALLAISVTALVYWVGLNGPFLLDDEPNILTSYIEQTGWDTFFYTISHNSSGMLGRSVSMISFVATGLIYGTDPWGYKFHNLVLHLLIGLLLFRLIYRVLPLLTGKVADRSTILIAGLTASLWLLHPLLASTVLYVVQRMTQLAAFFTLLALLAYIDFRVIAQWQLKQYLLAWVVFPLLLVLALLAKETGALIPLFILTLELLVFRANPPRWPQQRPLLIFLAVFVAIPLLLGALYFMTHLEVFLDYNGRTFTLGQRLMSELHVMGFYVKLLLLPRLQDMSLYHDDFPLTTAMDPVTGLLLLVLLAVVALIWLARHKAPVLSFGLAWFLTAHLLESTIFPLELVFEHRNYLAAGGLLLIPVYYLFQVPGIKRLPWLLVLVLPGFAMMTYSRAQEWQDESVMLAVGVSDHPNSARLRTEYANYLIKLGRTGAAIEQLEAAEKLQPTEPGALIHQLVYKCALEQEDPVLLDRAAAMLARYPASTYTFNTLGFLLSVVSKNDCDALSVADAQRLVLAAMSLDANRESSDTYAYLMRFTGIYHFIQGYYAQAVIDYRTAFEVSGNATMLAELFKYQLEYKQLGDAQDTLAFMKQINDSRHGAETHQIELLEQLMSPAPAAQ